MAISGVGQSYYQNNVATTKSTKSVNSTEETGNTKELSEAEEMAIFKKAGARSRRRKQIS